MTSKVDSTFNVYDCVTERNGILTNNQAIWTEYLKIDAFLNLRVQFIQLLYNEDTGLNDFFVKLEKRTSLRREQLAFVLIIVTAIYLVYGHLAEFLCNFIGFGYPAYASVQAIRSPAKEDDTKWLIYWTVFATFTLFDCFAERIMSILPLYWIIKAPFLLYVALPQTNGAKLLYLNIVDPLTTKIDCYIQRFTDHTSKAGRTIDKEK